LKQGDPEVAPKLAYSDAGVDRDLRARSKKALQALRQTYKHSRYGKVIELPYGKIFPFHDRYLDLAIEGVGTKVLIAQLAEKYDTIGIDGVAMAVNDVIRSGARPVAIADNIHAQASDPYLVKEWIRGIARAANEAECIVPSGEIGDVADLIKGLYAGKAFDMIFASIGEVAKEEVISGRNINLGDSMVGLKSSGVHSNGMSLARRVLFKQWGGKYEPDAVPEGLEQELVHEVLEPTRIYVKSFLSLAQKLEVKAAVHITGDAYLKFGRLEKFSRGVGFEFSNFKPQPIFDLIQETARQLKSPIADREMFRTFNMGWGFVAILEKADTDEGLDTLNKAGVESELIGHVTNSGGIRVLHRGKKIVLTSSLL
jgi:phosphoribosylformylglycinamidine cyclo-ligase